MAEAEGGRNEKEKAPCPACIAGCHLQEVGIKALSDVDVMNRIQTSDTLYCRYGEAAHNRL